MNSEENQIYFQKIDEIGDKIYDFYNSSNRDDLVMFYSMKENRIYSYIYQEFYDSLNEKSKMSLKRQFKEAKQENKIVLFIKDEERDKLKSFTI
jgi:hypothetical protein